VFRKIPVKALILETRAKRHAKLDDRKQSGLEA